MCSTLICFLLVCRASFSGFSYVFSFRIRDMLVRIRRIRTSDKRIRILLFSSVSFKMPIKFFLLIMVLFEGTLTSFFTDKSHKEVTKQ